MMFSTKLPTAIALLWLATPSLAQEEMPPDQQVSAIVRDARALRGEGRNSDLERTLGGLLALRDYGIMAEPDLLTEAARGDGAERVLFLRALADISCWLPGDDGYREVLREQLGPAPEEPQHALAWYVEAARLDTRLGGAERTLPDVNHRAGFGDALSADMALDVLLSHGPAAEAAVSGIRIRLVGADPALYGTGRILGLRQRAGRLLKALSDDPGDQRLAASMERIPVTRRARPASGGGVLTAAIRALAGPDGADARRAIENAGPKAVPALAAALQTHFSGNPPRVDVRPQICALLAGMGPTGSRLAPELWDTLANAPADLLPHVLDALAEVGPWSPQPLPRFDMKIEPAADGTDGTGTHGTGTHGAGPHGTVHYFGRPVLEKVDAEQLSAIGAAIDRCRARLERDPDRLPLELAADLTAPSAATRAFAADALRALGRPGYEALPSFRAALESPLLGAEGEDAHHRTAQAMTEVAAHPAAAVAAWGYLLEHGRTVYLRQQAAKALGECGAAAAPFVPMMAGQLTEGDPAVVRLLVPALGSLGRHAEPATEALQTLATEGTQGPALRKAAEAALARITQ